VSYLDRSQAKIWAAYARIPNTSWYVISSVPESKLTAEAQSVRNKMLLIGVLCLLMSLAFAAIISYSIAAPLNKLVDKMQHGSGSVGPYPRSQHGDRAEDELDRVGHSYDIMHDAVNRKIEEIKQMNASLERMVAERTRELSLANEKLTQLASYDALTGLPNRNLLDDRLQRAMVAALRNHHSLALMFIDLDKFKPINDLYGHDIGDLLLKEAAERIAACLREADTVSRIGGDEFIVLLPLIEQAQAATTVAEKLRQALCRPFALANRQLRISASIGIALYPQHGDNERALMKSADMAMYQAKDTGGNAVTLGAEPPWHERAN
jgi:diguanylate cyclase (GGDEF)-like protein